MADFAEIRGECCEANIALPQKGLVDLTFGNVSVYDPAAGAFAIKPSGVSYDKLTPADMVVLDLEGTVLFGSGRPSSDTPTHRYLYRAFGGAGVRAVVHTHSRHATSFAQAERGIPCLGTTHADYFYGEVPVTRRMTPEEIQGGEYEWETGKVIVERIGSTNPLEMPSVLVNGHAPFIWAGSGAKAVETALALEVVAEMAWRTLQLVRMEGRDYPGFSEPLLKKHFFRKHGPTAYYGQPL